ncbi:MAG TPA: type IV secretory system conjugative DNA transfer family protein [Mucilaginibacter sp.]|nr:type IV secretory system conjugative DNA transfer family protein [Mucilaginibacter sp.]
METVISFLVRCTQFILGLSIDFLNAVIDALAKPTGFSAKFGREGAVASRYNKGFVISKNRKLSRRKSFENILLCGPTGSGKTTRLLLKNLYAIKDASFIVNDPSKELYQLASGYLSKYFSIQTLNFSDSASSVGFNVLSRIKKPNDINKVAHLLVAASLDKGNSSDPFWSLQSKALLQLLIRLTLLQTEQYRNMANVVHLLHHFAAYPEKIDALIANTRDEKLILDYQSFISTPEKTLQNIVASAKAALQLFDDPEITKTTAYDTIDFDRLRRQPTLIFLHNSVGDQKYVSILNSIFFEQLYNHVLQRLPHKNELDLFVILEEASSLYVPLLPLAVANCRKHRIGNLICVQSPTQLKTNYRDEAENIAANCVTKVFLPGQTSMDVLKEIEALSGKCIYTDEKGTERVKPLITTDEIRLLPTNRSIIISGNKPIIKGRTSPYYRSLVYKRHSQMPPVPIQWHIPDTPVPTLKIK